MILKGLLDVKSMTICFGRIQNTRGWPNWHLFAGWLFLKQGCLRFLDHTVLCRFFFGESGGIIALSLIWWDYSVIFHQSLLDMEASHFPRVHTSQIHLPVVKVHGTVPEVHGLYKPIHWNCAIYFYPGVDGLWICLDGIIESSTRPLYLGSYIYYPLAAQESAKTEKVKEVPWAIGYLWVSP